MDGRISSIVLVAWRLDRKWILDCFGAQGGFALGGASAFIPGLMSPARRAAIGFMGGFILWGSFFWGLALDRVMWGPDQT